jgi:ribonuclease VapC
LIVDSSALLALVFGEPDAERIEASIAGAEWLGVGAPTLTETGIVLASRLGDDSELLLARLIEGLDLAVVPFTPAHGRSARKAFLRFGRGRHPAALNFGDCLTYAIAKLANEPLLFIGEDFARTDLEAALGSA